MLLVAFFVGKYVPNMKNYDELTFDKEVKGE